MPNIVIIQNAIAVVQTVALPFLFIHIPNICHTESENEFFTESEKKTSSSISISDRKS